MFGLPMKFIVNVMLILFCCTLTVYLNDLKKVKKCPIKKNWKLNNGILLINVLLIATVVNLMLPLHNFFYALPLIGGWYIFLFALWIFIILYNVTSISNEIKNNKDNPLYQKCINDKTKTIYNAFKNNTVITNLLLSPIFTMLYFYAIKN